jgi:hypothetical protein
MRTENDLRMALRRRADQVPQPSPALLARAKTSQPHPNARPRLTLALAVAMVAALIAVPFAISRHDAGDSGGVATAPGYDPDAADALSWATVDDNLNSSRNMDRIEKQETIVVLLPGGVYVTLIDYAPGTFGIDRILQREPVTINGLAGYYGQVATQAMPSPFPGESAQELERDKKLFGPQPALAWQVAPNQWVVLSHLGGGSLSSTKATLLAIAPRLGVRARTEPVRMPLKLGYLPAGWTLDTAGFGPPPPGRPGPIVAVIGLLNGNKRFALILSADAPTVTDVGRKFGDLWVVLNQDQGTLDAATVRRILDSVVVAAQPGSENGSWFASSTILP